MSDLSPKLQEKLKRLPKNPGVYQHKDAQGKVLYIGKAKNLRNRVRSYFIKNKQLDTRIKAMVSKVDDIEIIITDTEAEALILENNLIKSLKPRYNINLRDDKTYPYICIKNEPFPRVFPTRKVFQDGSKYFGPYTDVKNMKLMLETIRALFQIRDCSLKLTAANISAKKFDACLQFHIKRCHAPCIGLESSETYEAKISQIKTLLNGKTEGLVAQLTEEMKQLALQKQFEAAATLRDRIQGLKNYAAKQKIVSETPTDRDLFAISRDQETGLACGVVFKVREGKLIGKQQKYMNQISDVSDESLMQAFLENYYTETTFFPDEVFLSSETEDAQPLEALLHLQRGKKVIIHTPQRGEKAALMRMIEANAKLLLEEYKLQKQKQSQDKIPRSVRSLQRDLYLDKLPRRIECFDISHLAGTGTVASCIVFIDGMPKKSEYRKFKIRSVEGKPDDFQSMREVITRRYKRVMEENGAIPDLVVIDGGKGQLSSAIEAMKAIGFYGKAPVVGLAKRLEEIFFPKENQSIMIPKTSSAMHLMQRIRDEAHRFAITFQRQQRKNTTLHSELMEIHGIGAKTVQKLLSHFGSVKQVKNATPETLEKIIGKNSTQKLVHHFAKKNEKP